MFVYIVEWSVMLLFVGASSDGAEIPEAVSRFCSMWCRTPFYVSLCQNVCKTIMPETTSTTTTTTKSNYLNYQMEAASSSVVIGKILSGVYYASASLLAQLTSSSTIVPTICYNEIDVPLDLTIATFSNGSLRYPNRNSYGYYACPLTGVLRQQACCGDAESQTCCDIVVDTRLPIPIRIIVSALSVIVSFIFVLVLYRLCWSLKKSSGKILCSCCEVCRPSAFARVEVRCVINTCRISSPRQRAVPRNVNPLPTVSATVSSPRARCSLTNSTARSITIVQSPSTTSQSQSRSHSRTNTRPQQGGVQQQRRRARSAHARNNAYEADDLPSYSELFRYDATATRRGKRTHTNEAPPPYEC